MSNKLSIGNPSAAAKLAALRAKAAAAKPDALAVKEQLLPPPADCPERLRLIADDSGSMTRHEADVREGIIEFFRNCIPGQTAAAVHLLCRPDTANKMSTLNSNLLQLASWIKTEPFGWGGTPLFTKLKLALEATPKATRLIAFTDGSPTDHLAEYLPYEQEKALALPFRGARDAAIVTELACTSRIPIDTIFFGSGVSRNWETGQDEESDEVKLLKYLASATGGYFLKFDPAKTSFKQGLKYLAPGLRLMLASESVRKEVEEGRKA